MNKKIEYVGKDLEAMDFAVNYHRWILGLIKPFLGTNLVEVGAGTGAFSELLLETNPQKLALVEPSEMIEQLKLNIENESRTAEINIYPNIFVEVAKQIKTENIPDSIIYINVLEHIEDDLSELKVINETLSANGHVFIFVPALPVLYSSFDKQIGHFRRYRKHELEEKCRDAGFNLVLSRYFDSVGIIPWFVKYRLLNSTKMESNAVHLYDRLAVPIIKTIENLLPPPIGKNILIVGKKL